MDVTLSDWERGLRLLRHGRTAVHDEGRAPARQAWRLQSATDPFPLEQRSAAWDEALRRIGLAALCESGPADGRLLHYRTPQGNDIALIASGPQRLLRPSQGGADHIWLATLLQSSAQLPGNAAAAAEGELLYWPPSAGPLLHPTGKFRLLLIRFSQRELHWAAMPRSGDASDSGPERPGRQPVLAALMATIAEAIEASADAALPALENALAEIMPTALGLLAGRSARRAALRRRILRAIDTRLDDPLLNLARFAEAEGISTRAVQKLLENGGHSFRQYLRQRRLIRAAEALGDPAQAAVPVAEVGFRCGFVDPAHFSTLGFSPAVRYFRAPSAVCDILRTARLASPPRFWTVSCIADGLAQVSDRAGSGGSWDPDAVRHYRIA